MSKTILIARLAAPHGVQGSIKCLCFLENPKDLAKYSGKVLRADGKPWPTFKVLGQSAGQILLHFTGHTSRNDVESLRGQELWLPRDLLPAEPEEDGSFYMEDLVGLQVLNTAGEKVGKVISVQNYGASDLLEIEDNHGARELYTFTEANFPEVDIEGGCITFTPPEFLE